MTIFCVNASQMLSFISSLEKEELDISLTVSNSAIHIERYMLKQADSSSMWAHATAGMRGQQDGWLSKGVLRGQSLPQDLTGSRSGLQPHWTESGFSQNIQEWNHDSTMTKKKKKILAFSPGWKERVCVGLAAEWQPPCNHEGNQSKTNQERQINQACTFFIQRLKTKPQSLVYLWSFHCGRK